MKRKSVWLEICIYVGMLPHSSKYIFIGRECISVTEFLHVKHPDDVHAPHAINRSLFETKIENARSFLLPNTCNVNDLN